MLATYGAYARFVGKWAVHPHARVERGRCTASISDSASVGPRIAWLVRSYDCEWHAEDDMYEIQRILLVLSIPHELFNPEALSQFMLFSRRRSRTRLHSCVFLGRGEHTPSPGQNRRGASSRVSMSTCRPQQIAFSKSHLHRCT